MKTTIEIADPLFEAAKETARARGTTLRALVEIGLRQVIEAPAKGSKPFRLRKASVGGQGLQRGARTMSWDQLREAAYGDRGG